MKEKASGGDASEVADAEKATGTRLRAIRLTKGLTLTDVASQAEVTNASSASSGAD